RYPRSISSGIRYAKSDFRKGERARIPISWSRFVSEDAGKKLRTKGFNLDMLRTLWVFHFPVFDAFLRQTGVILIQLLGFECGVTCVSSGKPE
ncbi:MAG: hypothetical protein AAB209_03100, partial [Bacteroidota bacterium]